MLHRIRLAMQTESFLLRGEVEVDETFIGGKGAQYAQKRSREEGPQRWW